VQVYDSECDDLVTQFDDTYWIYRAEAIPQEELDLAEGDRVLYLCHVSLKDDKRVRLT
jgi:hypothetical protein